MDDELRYAIENGMIDLDCLRNSIKMNKRKELLEKHPYAITESKDGKWRTYFPDEKKGRVQRERKTKKEIEDLIVEFWRDKEENPTLEDVFNDWNDHRAELKKISPATQMRNRQVFARHYGSGFGKKKIEDIDPEELQDFLEKQIPQFQLTAKAFGNLKGITKGCLKWARRKKLISYDIEPIFAELDVSRDDYYKTIHEDCEEVFNEEELPVIIDYLKEHIDEINLCLLLLFAGGIRVGEAVALKHDDIHEDYICIRRTETRFKVDGKGYQCIIKDFPKTEAGVRDVVFPEQYLWILKELQALHPDKEYIFYSPVTGERMHTQCPRKRLKRICEELNIYPKSPHKARKTYGSILMDCGADRRFVTDQMGHTDICCSERNYHRNRRSIERKKEILSGIKDFDN